MIWYEVSSRHRSSYYCIQMIYTHTFRLVFSSYYYSSLQDLFHCMWLVCSVCHFRKMLINVWLKIITCSCTLLYGKRKCHFTSSTALLVASLIDLFLFTTLCKSLFVYLWSIKLAFNKCTKELLYPNRNQIFWNEVFRKYFFRNNYLESCCPEQVIIV